MPKIIKPCLTEILFDLRPSARASKDILCTMLDLVWRARLFVCKITLLARVLGLKGEQSLGQARLQQ